MPWPRSLMAPCQQIRGRSARGEGHGPGARSATGEVCAPREPQGRTALRIAAGAWHHREVVDDAAAETAIEHCERLGEGRPIVVGVDGSSESERGLRYAADLAAALGVDLVVVHALGLTSRRVDWRTPTEERIEIVEERLANEWVAPLAEMEAVHWRSQVVDGQAALGLLAVADESDASMIVVGSHGSGGSGDPFLGSTSHRIVAESHRPVVVVPPGGHHVHRRGGAGAMADVVADPGE